MTDKDSSQNFNPKHRVIGAVVIVVLAVILVPLILGEHRPASDLPVTEVSGDVSTDAESAKETGETETKVAVTVVTPPATSVAPTATAVAPVPPSDSVKLREPIKTEPIKTSESAKVVDNAPPKKPTPVPVTASKATTVTNGWVVQVGTFSNTDNAKRVQDKLRALGQNVRAESISIGGGKAVRVRVGPFGDKTAAVKAQERIQKETGINVVVLSYP